MTKSGDKNKTLQETIIRELDSPDENKRTLVSKKITKLGADLFTTNRLGGTTYFIAGENSENSLAMWFIEELKKHPLEQPVKATNLLTTSTKQNEELYLELSTSIRENDLLLFLPHCLSREHLTAITTYGNAYGAFTWGLLRPQAVLRKFVAQYIEVSDNYSGSEALYRDLFTIFNDLLVTVSERSQSLERPRGFFSGRSRESEKKARIQDPHPVSET